MRNLSTKLPAIAVLALALVVLLGPASLAQVSDATDAFRANDDQPLDYIPVGDSDDTTLDLLCDDEDADENPDVILFL